MQQRAHAQTRALTQRQPRVYECAFVSSLRFRSIAARWRASWRVRAERLGGTHVLRQVEELVRLDPSRATKDSRGRGFATV